MSSRPCTRDLFFTAVSSFCCLAWESLRNSRSGRAAPVKHPRVGFVTLRDNGSPQWKTLLLLFLCFLRLPIIHEKVKSGLRGKNHYLRCILTCYAKCDSGCFRTNLKAIKRTHKSRTVLVYEDLANSKLSLGKQCVIQDNSIKLWILVNGDWVADSSNLFKKEAFVKWNMLQLLKKLCTENRWELRSHRCKILLI